MTSIEEIQKQFNEVVEFSQGVAAIDTDELFNQWKEAKRDIIELFDGKLIYTYPKKVSFVLSEADKKTQIEMFINKLYDEWHYRLAQFVEKNKAGFYDNKVLEDQTIIDSDNKEHFIQKGTKLLKTFKYFITNPKKLNDCQMEASRVIQENKIEGTLCLSVHPLDYLSISENNHNWRSCHALDGSYRAGNISYMLDNTTIICYLKSDEDVILPHFPSSVKWNNKKWRVLLYLSNDWKMIFAGRPYPFSSESGMQFILDNILNNQTNKILNENRTLYDEVKWSKWQKPLEDSFFNTDDIKYKYHNLFVPLNYGVKELGELVKDSSQSKHYNDVLYSSCYKPIYTVLQNKGSKYSKANYRRTSFIVGGRTECLKCNNAPVYDNNTMFCMNCEIKYGTIEGDTFGPCSRCGRRICYDNSSELLDDLVCNDCYSELAKVCGKCGWYFLKDDMYYDKNKNKYYCKECYKEEF